MKTILTIIFFLFSTIAVLGNEKLKKCDGFCEGEELEITVAAYPQPSYRVIDGKRKKSPKWMIARVAQQPDSPCIIFDSFIERAIPRKVKKKDFDKYMEDFRTGNEIFQTMYSINSCIPCPAGKKPDKKYKKTGYCVLPMITLFVMYKTGWDKGYFPPETADFSILGIGGRDTNFDILNNLPNANDKVVFEILTFPTSLKDELEIARYKDKSTGKLDWIYHFNTYKTAARNQIRKQTEWQYVNDTNLTNYLNSYVEKTQKIYSSVFNKGSENYKKTSKLYELIPTDNDLKNFNQSFKKVATYHVQNRQ